MYQPFFYFAREFWFPLTQGSLGIPTTYNALRLHVYMFRRLYVPTSLCSDTLNSQYTHTHPNLTFILTLTFVYTYLIEKSKQRAVPSYYTTILETTRSVLP